MMMNLFSMFDPSTSIFNISFNWLSILLGMLVIPMSFWLLPNCIYIVYTKIILTLYSEFKIISSSKNSETIILFVSIFLFILFSNFISLFPYIFTGTSHLVLNLTLALPLWFSFFIFSWIEKTNNTFTHLVPSGTPMGLIPFMVLIETISSLIRPITLMIRLTANLIAGHLLLTLLGNLGPSIFLLFIPILLIIQMMLLTLEAAVAMIQSYVFSVLMTLYYSEI